MRLFRCLACDRIYKVRDSCPNNPGGRCNCGARYSAEEVERFAVPWRPLPDGLHTDLTRQHEMETKEATP